MRKKLLWLLLLPALLLAWQQLFLHPSPPGAPASLQVPSQPRERILLVPLDGRPPCRQFPVDAGAIAGFQVEVPPSSLQDYYSLKGDREGMMAWVKEAIPGAGAAILSIDQLLYGGLLAAREENASDAEIDALVLFLRQLHADHPGIPLYAFSILPRLAPQDSIDGYEERRCLMAYSRLLGRQAAGEPVDSGELSALAARIPPDILEKYLSHFEESQRVARKLADLAAEGVLARLILGQDDGEKYGIPNIEKRSLQDFLKNRGIPEDRVFLAHGADEIALTLLAEIKCRSSGYRPRIFVEYSTEEASSGTMPFMAIPTGDCVEEKLRMMRAERASRPEDADFTLFVSANSRETLSSRLPAARKVKEMAELGRPVALVDLSRSFSPEECLLPLLIREQAPVNGLLAYAGWNTASNSIGTALSQAILCSARKREARTKEDVLALCQKNLVFLQNRCLEDYFYLKDVIDHVNIALKREGYRNTADLDLARNWRWANAMLQGAMKERILSYRESAAFRKPFAIDAPEGALRLHAKDLAAEMSYPWPRTFEIQLQTTLAIEESKEDIAPWQCPP